MENNALIWGFVLAAVLFSAFTLFIYSATGRVQKRYKNSPTQDFFDLVNNSDSKLKNNAMATSTIDTADAFNFDTKAFAGNQSQGTIAKGGACKKSPPKLEIVSSNDHPKKRTDGSKPDLQWAINLAQKVEELKDKKT